MKNKRNLKIMAVTGLGALALTIGVSACGHHGHHGINPERLLKMVSGHLDDALDRLKATPKQRRQIHALKARLFKAGKKLHGHKGKLVRKVMAVFKKKNPEVKALHGLIDSKLDSMKIFAYKAADTLIQAFRILNARQRALVMKKFSKHLTCK